jgi:hypothetical protein
MPSSHPLPHPTSDPSAPPLLLQATAKATLQQLVSSVFARMENPKSREEVHAAASVAVAETMAAAKAIEEAAADSPDTEADSVSKPTDVPVRHRPCNQPWTHPVHTAALPSHLSCSNSLCVCIRPYTTQSDGMDDASVVTAVRSGGHVDNGTVNV